MLWIGGRGLPGAKSKRKPRAQWGPGLWVRSRAQSNTSWTPAKPLEDEWDKFEKHLYPEPGEGSPRLQETAADLSVASTGCPPLTWNFLDPQQPHPSIPRTHLGGGRMRPRVR